jgi:biopolymer transport protein ExbD
MLRNVALSLILFVLLAAAHLASAQQIHLPPAAAQGASMGTPPVVSGDENQKKQADAANTQRQEEIRRDMDKMLQLTEELKDYLQKTDRGVMSVDAIKKAEQIEKLAHGVKSKMKQSY